MKKKTQKCKRCEKAKVTYGLGLCYNCLSATICPFHSQSLENQCYGKFSCRVCKAKREHAFVERGEKEFQKKVRSEQRMMGINPNKKSKGPSSIEICPF